MKTFIKLARDRRGASAVEYALIISLLVMAMMAGLRTLGGGTGGKWQGVAEDVAAATR
jgi:pilus assembly protein Flp/PilA